MSYVVPSRKHSLRLFSRRSHHPQRQRGHRISVERLEDRCLLAWIPQGPAPIVNGGVEKVAPANEVIGSVHAVLTDPTDADTVYIGATNGGVWRTRNATSSSPNWEFLTDGLPSQSISDISFDADDSARLVAGYGRFSSFDLEGGSLSGLILTEDGGDTWTQITDPVLAEKNITGVQVRGSSLVAAAGGELGIIEAFPDHGGLFRSTDGGQTWQSIELLMRDPLRPLDPIPFNVVDLESDPTEPNRLYAAVLGVGIFRSDDFGESWFNATANDTVEGGIDEAITTLRPAGLQNNTTAGTEHNHIEITVATNGWVYAAVLEDGLVEYIGYGEGGGTVWTAMDLPQTNEVVNGVATTVGLNPNVRLAADGPIYISLTADPDDPETVYIGGDSQDGTTSDFSTGNSLGARDTTGRLFRGDTRILPTRAVVVNAQNVVQQITQVTPSPQWEHLTHSRVVPAIPEGGTSNRSAPHAHSRDMTFDAAGDLIQVDDGGIYRRTMPRNNTGDWFSMNGSLQITELRDIAYDSRSNILVGGAQDNANIQQVSPGSLIWETVVLLEQQIPGRLSGDGGDVAIDDTTVPGFSIRYTMEDNATRLKRQTFDVNNNLVRQVLLNVPQFAYPAYTPIELNSLDEQRIILGGVLESTDRGDTFTQIAGLEDINMMPLIVDQDAIVYGGRRNGVDNLDLLYVGAGDEVFVRTERDEPLQLSQAQFPGGRVLDIVINPEDWATVYVVDENNVYRSSNAGRTWIPITGNLPNLDVGGLRTLAYVPGDIRDTIVIGSDRGTFFAATTNPTVWQPLSTGMPAAIVHELDYDSADDVLAAAMLGRGAYLLPDASIEVGGSTGEPVDPPDPPDPPDPVDPPVDPEGNAVSGTKWDDRDGDGSRDAEEPGLFGWTIFADLNDNQALDSGEPSTITDNAGRYVLTDLDAGSVTIRELTRERWQQTFPGGGGGHVVTVRDEQTVTGIDFGNRLLMGMVTGAMFHDANQNGTRDEGEAGIGGLFVYFDLDNDGVPGLGEPFGISGPDGSYSIREVPNGSFHLRQVPHPGWRQTHGPADAISVNAGETVANVAFGHARQFDYGDAPASYGTASAMHGINPDLFLGNSADFETAPRPSVDANSDDATGADEDGVVFLTGLQPGRTEQVAVFATNLSVSPAYLQGWIDFDRDGDFDDEGDQVIRNRRLANGTNVVDFQVPSDAVEGASYARFRWGVELDMAPDQPAVAGEVEDYDVTLPMGPDTGVMTLDDQFTVNEDSQDNSLDVLSNDFSRFADTIEISEVSPTTSGGTVAIDNGLLIYTPAPNFFGLDSFSYSIVDSTGGTGSAEVQVTVTPVNDDPTAIDDVVAVGQGSRLNELDVLANDRIDPDENETLVIGSIGATTSGGTVTVGPASMTLLYTPPADFLGTDTFTYTVRDGNGGFDEATVVVEVTELPDRVRFRLEITDEGGNPIESIGEETVFQLRAYVEDLRDVPQGVFSAYLDVEYEDAEIIEQLGMIAVQPPYENNPSGTHTRGLLDEVGGVDGIEPLGGEERLLFLAAFAATTTGTVTFTANPADNVPLHAVELFGESSSVRNADIEFGSATIVITGSSTSAIGDQFSVDEDSTDNSLDVLSNDTLGAGGTREITAVSTPASGGSAVLGPDAATIEYTPPADFFGADSFTYTVSDDQGNTDSATVSITVVNVNDPPSAVDDQFSFVSDVRLQLDVLDNDSFLPDPPETLVVATIDQPDNGGAVELAPDQASILYTPAEGFEGDETFRYTISDGNGGRDSATVTVSVLPNDGMTEIQARFLLEVVDGNGTTVQNVTVGSDYQLVVSVEDLREVPQGVFSAYLDVNYDNSLITVDAGNALFNEEKFPFADSIDIVGSQIDELGAVDGLTPTGGGAVEVVRVPFRVDAIGEITFTGEPADDSPLHDVLFFDTEVPLSEDVIDFGTVTVTATGVAARTTFTNPVNPLDVDANGEVGPLDALLVINEMQENGPRQLPEFAARAGQFAALSEVMPKYFVDVNADGYVSPIDALMIIREVTRQNADRRAFAALSIDARVDDSLRQGAAPEHSFRSSTSRSLTPTFETNAEAQTSVSAAAARESAQHLRMLSSAAMEENLGLFADDVTAAWDANK